MNILLLWQYYPPDKMGLALSARGEAFAKYLRRMGNEVRVIAPDFEYTKSSYIHEKTRVDRFQTFESLRVKHNLGESFFLLPFAFLNLIRRVREFDPSLLIVSQPSYTLPFQGLLLARLLGIPCVLDMQDIFAQEREFFPHKARNRLKLLLEGFVFRNVDFIFAVLPGMRDMATESYRIPAEKFEILYNGIDSERFPQVSLDDDQKDIDLVHIGGPRAYYDTMRFIDAFDLIVRKRPQTKLVFTDYIAKGYQKDVREYIEKKGLGKNVDFLGQLSREDVLSLMSRSKVGIYTLYNRSSSRVVVGTKTFEYMAMGLPVAHMGWKGGEMDRLIQENGH